MFLQARGILPKYPSSDIIKEKQQLQKEKYELQCLKKEEQLIAHEKKKLELMKLKNLKASYLVLKK